MKDLNAIDLKGAVQMVRSSHVRWVLRWWRVNYGFRKKIKVWIPIDRSNKTYTVGEASKIKEAARLGLMKQ